MYFLSSLGMKGLISCLLEHTQERLPPMNATHNSYGSDWRIGNVTKQQNTWLTRMAYVRARPANAAGRVPLISTTMSAVTPVIVMVSMSNLTASQRLEQKNMKNGRVLVSSRFLNLYQSINQSINQWINQPINKSMNEWMNQSIPLIKCQWV